MNTPFNQTSYTAELIQNQQARTIGDVLANDPSTRVVSTAGGGQDVYFIRGFYYDPGDLALNGLYGIAPFYSTAANFVERVEVLKGPSALLTGMPPGGAVGGSINLITKKALPYDLTQLTMGYISKSQFGAQLDISRRYGEFKEYGIRYNGGYRSGATAIDNQTDEFANSHIGVDYTGERLRVSADVGTQANNLNPATRFVSFLGTVVPIPQAPRAESNFIVPWATWRTKDSFASVKAEVDVTEWATVYGAIGYHDSKIDAISVAPVITNANGNYQANALRLQSEFRTTSGEVGVRANVDTGPVNHALNVNFSATDRPNDNIFSAGTPVLSNIYNPVAVPQQNPSNVLVRNLLTTKLSSVGFADTMSILDKRVQFTAGVRRQTVGQDTFNVINGASTTYEQSVWSPAFALLIKPVEQLSLYANYIEGLQPGSAVGGTFANAGQVFPPFQSKQTEVGAKVNFGRVTTTFSLFQIAQPALVAVAALPLPTQELAGEQRNRGFEMNVFGEVTPDFRLLGGIAFIDGRLTKTAGGLQDGNKAVGVANINLNIGAEWDTPFLRGLTLTGRTIYTSEQFVNTANTQILPEWVRFDLGARYAFVSPWNGKPIVVRAAVENVANNGYWSSAYNGVVARGAPRTYLVSTTFNF